MVEYAESWLDDDRLRTALNALDGFVADSREMAARPVLGQEELAGLDARKAAGNGVGGAPSEEGISEVSQGISRVDAVGRGAPRQSAPRPASAGPRR